MKFVLLVAAFLQVSFSAYSCSCAPQWGATGFCSIVANARTRAMFCVVQAKVVSWYEWGMYVKVLDNIAANANNDTILVWGDNGACCRPSVSSAFKLGDTVIMSLEQTDFMGNYIAPGLPDYEEATHYVLQGCGAYYMHYHSGKVTGTYDNDEIPDTINYETFKTRLRDCWEQSGVPARTAEAGITIYPNPAHTAININAPCVIDELQLYNPMGQCVWHMQPAAKDVNADLSHLPAGMYMLTIYSGGRKTISHHRILRQ